jgi:uncharacterized protein
MTRHVLVLLLLPVVLAAADTKAKPKGKANRLAKSSSPYLLQHAHNPVDWHPWGEEAFKLAKKEKKLVFLSIGYSACHWCHVMEKESFSNEEVAKILNKHFICIKVDREERPDVDQIYMTSLNVLGQSGGWPLSMFLDAEGRPIIGGTYWPREDKEEDGKTYTGFKTVLTRVQDLHEKQPDDLKKQADAVAKAATRALAGLGVGVALIELDRKLIDGVVAEVKEGYDKVHGGFGNAERKFRGPKFPMPSTLRFLQNEAKRAKANDLAAMVETSLDKMALGGIYDHLGGGFARYTVERSWTVPHFEKMLYDNAQLLELYADAYKSSKKPLHRRAMRQTIDWLAREMTSPEGAFYSALDADSEGEEGKFYIWTAKELAEAIMDKEDLKLFKKVYGAEDGPNFEDKYSILRLAEPADDKLDARLAGMRAKLFKVREKRPRPFLDTKVLTAWNGQMIAGLAKAGQALDDKKAIEAATKAARFVLGTLKTKEGRLLRSYAAAPGEKPQARFNGYLDDYAYLVHGLLTLHEVTGDKAWLAEAKALTDTMAKYHGDEKGGGFFYTSSDHEKFFARAKDQYDGAQPAANSIAARNLVRLWRATGEAKYGTLAEKTFKALSPTLKTSPSSLPALADAMSAWLEKK